MPFDTPTDTQAAPNKRRDIVSGNPFSVGDGFNALSFRHGMYEGAMDPLIMVDHFVMTEPTFGAHAHAGLSAVSILLEDSQGRFHNKDSLGNDVDLMPGDLYWLKAGRGAVHDEKPRPGGHTHALQVFVNLPARMKYDAPTSLHVKASDMPILSGNGYRARLMLGESGNARGHSSPALPMTILDVMLDAGGRFEHTVPTGKSAFILVIDGAATARLDRKTVMLSRDESISFRRSDANQRLVLTAEAGAHIAILQAAPVEERFVQKGPFAMSTQDEVDAMVAAHKDGKLGSIDA
ncbi:MAG: pirin [Ponticaulis sp.]|nr:pirin [Ponticaulis sp.]|tara:strand:- start:40582 stop:41460 length:879 start_codon:yes stop_codon:yes gene_type:complete